MDNMEVDSGDMDSGRGLDDPEEPSTPDERMFDMDSPLLDREKDEEPIKAIRYEAFEWRLSHFCCSTKMMAGPVKRVRKQEGEGEDVTTNKGNKKQTKSSGLIQNGDFAAMF